MLARCHKRKGRSPSIWFSALLLAAGAALTSCAVKEPAIVEGTWVITSSVTPGISAMLPEQTESWLGKSFQYAPDNVVLGQVQCGPSKWKKQSLSDTDFQREYRVSFQQLGIIANSIQRFDVECGAKTLPGQSVLVTDRDRAFTVWDGVFFQMEKADTVL